MYEALAQASTPVGDRGLAAPGHEHLDGVGRLCGPVLQPAKWSGAK